MLYVINWTTLYYTKVAYEQLHIRALDTTVQVHRRKIIVDISFAHVVSFKIIPRNSPVNISPLGFATLHPI